jgi:D-alanyl-D-alanine carboxypeptidase/D-alanyl-D-alanine-endopeptidase (penicillin-binding protein 4)
LKAAGRTRVALRLDDSLFAAPAISPDWAAGDIREGFVAPVMALEVNAGRVSGARFARRASDPAMAAAATFAALLGRDGISVTGAVVRARASGSATPLAAVHSASVGDLVEYAMTESDNTVAEALARLVALHSDQRRRSTARRRPCCNGSPTSASPPRARLSSAAAGSASPTRCPR